MMLMMTGLSCMCGIVISILTPIINRRLWDDPKEEIWFS